MSHIQKSAEIFRWRRVGAVVASLVVMLGGCSKREDLSDRVARQIERDRELGQIHLDPARCPGGGDGMLYVALGDLVLRVPNFSMPTMREPVYTGAEKLPTPPDLDAPEGCREHPARAQALHLSALLAQHPELIDAPVTTISVFSIDGERFANQEIAERAFDRLRAQRECTPLPSGLTICGSRTDDSPRARGLQTAAGAVGRGPRWVATCGYRSLLVDECTVYYLLRQGMAVRYLFNQQQVSLERMYQLDPAIRDWLAALVVENYPWP